MADIVTGTVTGQLDASALHQDHADIRRENVQSEANVRRDVMGTSADSSYQNATQHGSIVDAVKTAGWANSDRTGTEADRVVGQSTAYFIAGQQNDFSNATALAALKASTDASFQQTLSAISLASHQSTAASALAAEKIGAANALGQAQIERALVQEGMSTRALINDLKYHDLNRAMVERNAELVEERYGRRHWRDTAQQNQYAAQTAALQTSIQAFGSQLQETRQGVVNLGTMSGAAGQQTSSNNNL